MRDKDSILLEKILSEMGKNLSYSRILPQDRETRTSRAQTGESQTERIIRAQQKISRLFKNLDSNPDDYTSALDIYNTVKDAVSTEFEMESDEDDDASTMAMSSGSKREEFLVDGEELTWQEIYQKVLDKTITDFHDYKKLLPTSQGGKGFKIDHFMKEKIPMKDPDTGEVMRDEKDQVTFYKKTPEDIELIRAFYLLYEKILRDLGTEVTPRSCRELPGTHAEKVYYFDDNNNPIQTTVYVRSDGKTCPGSFDKKRNFLGKRAPKVKGYSKWSPSELVEKPFEDVLERIKNDEAYEAFIQKYPPYIEDEFGNQKPSMYSWMYGRSGKPPKGFWDFLAAKENGTDQEEGEESLEEESYKTFLEHWNKNDMDDFENETEEDLYDDHDDDDEECSCGGDNHEECSCEE